MKLLFLISSFHHAHTAESLILHNLLGATAFREHEITVISFGPTSERETVGNIISIQKENPYLKGGLNLRRLLRKVSYLTGGLWVLAPSRSFLRSAKREIAGEEFDAIVALAGNFYVFEAAASLAKSLDKPLVLYYLDAFTNSHILCSTQKKRRKVEQRWAQVAKKIFYLGGIPDYPFPEHMDKVSNLNGPLLTLPFPSKSGSDTKSIVYGGVLYPGVREIDSVLALAASPEFSDCDFHLYVGRDEDRGNVHFHRYLPQDQFDSVCSHASALVFLGNQGMDDTVPSKLISQLRFQKQILAFADEKMVPTSLKGRLVLCEKGMDPSEIREELKTVRPMGEVEIRESFAMYFSDSVAEEFLRHVRSIVRG